jgi:excisionase family DNA binding protein
MRFTAEELAEIRSAFRQRVATEPARKSPVRRKPRRAPRALPALVREPDYDDADVLTTTRVAELFGVSGQTVGLWADVGLLPSFRTVGGHRRFRWADIRPRTAHMPG